MSANQVRSQVLTIGDKRLRIAEPIGQGAYGCVYRALDESSGCHVAVKVMNGTDQSLQLAVSREVSLLQTLKHKNIVSYIGAARGGKSSTFIVLEYVDGGSLLGTIRKFGPLNETLCARYVAQVLEGLAYLHAQGVIHNDMKAANLLLTTDGTVKISDFGISQRKDSRDGPGVGSPYWMAPEQLEGHSSVASDIWAVGATVIELLTGSPPYFDLEVPHAIHQIICNRNGPPLPTDITQSCSEFLASCFRAEENIRSSAEELLRHPWVKGFAHRPEALKIRRVEATAREIECYDDMVDGDGDDVELHLAVSRPQLVNRDLREFVEKDEGDWDDAFCSDGDLRLQLVSGSSDDEDAIAELVEISNADEIAQKQRNERKRQAERIVACTSTLAPLTSIPKNQSARANQQAVFDTLDIKAVLTAAKEFIEIVCDHEGVEVLRTQHMIIPLLQRLTLSASVVNRIPHFCINRVANLVSRQFDEEGGLICEISPLLQDVINTAQEKNNNSITVDAQSVQQIVAATMNAICILMALTHLATIGPELTSTACVLGCLPPVISLTSLSTPSPARVAAARFLVAVLGLTGNICQPLGPGEPTWLTETSPADKSVVRTLSTSTIPPKKSSPLSTSPNTLDGLDSNSPLVPNMRSPSIQQEGTAQSEGMGALPRADHDDEEWDISESDSLAGPTLDSDKEEPSEPSESKSSLQSYHSRTSSSLTDSDGLSSTPESDRLKTTDSDEMLSGQLGGLAVAKHDDDEWDVSSDSLSSSESWGDSTESDGSDAPPLQLPGTETALSSAPSRLSIRPSSPLSDEDWHDDDVDGQDPATPRRSSGSDTATQVAIIFIAAGGLLSCTNLLMTSYEDNAELIDAGLVITTGILGVGRRNLLQHVQRSDICSLLADAGFLQPFTVVFQEIAQFQTTFGDNDQDGHSPVQELKLIRSTQHARVCADVVLAFASASDQASARLTQLPIASSLFSTLAIIQDEHSRMTMLRASKQLAMNSAYQNALGEANLIETLTSNFIGKGATYDIHVIPTLYYLCRANESNLFRVVQARAFSDIITLVREGSSLKQFLLPLYFSAVRSLRSHDCVERADHLGVIFYVIQMRDPSHISTACQALATYVNIEAGLDSTSAKFDSIFTPEHLAIMPGAFEVRDCHACEILESFDSICKHIKSLCAVLSDDANFIPKLFQHVIYSVATNSVDAPRCRLLACNLILTLAANAPNKKLFGERHNLLARLDDVFQVKNDVVVTVPIVLEQIKTILSDK